MTNSFGSVSIKKSIGRVPATIAKYAVLVLFSLLILIPFYTILVTSVKSNNETINRIPFTWWPLEGFHFGGYKNVFFGSAELTGTSIMRGFGNSLLYYVPTVLIGLLTSTLAAYAFAKLRFRYKRFLFGVLMFSLMLPGVVLIAPSYILYDIVHWTDSPLPLMLPGMFGGVACIFFMKQFIGGLPTELIEAAKVDGLNHPRIFASIIVPLCKPALVAQAFLWFLACYNDYFSPLLYLKSPEKYTLQIALNFTTGIYMSDWQSIMAGCVVAMLPMLIVYFCFQNVFMEGIVMSGLKA